MAASMGDLRHPLTHPLVYPLTRRRLIPIFKHPLLSFLLFSYSFTFIIVLICPFTSIQASATFLHSCNLFFETTLQSLCFQIYVP